MFWIRFEASLGRQNVRPDEEPQDMYELAHQLLSFGNFHLEDRMIAVENSELSAAK
jgi:hypothetical protein